MAGMHACHDPRRRSLIIANKFEKRYKTGSFQLLNIRITPYPF